MDLGPWYYRHVGKSHGGPIEELVHHSQQLPSGAAFVAHTKLIPAVRGHFQNCGYAIYGDYDGSGTDISLRIARYKAISEALERWAFWQSHAEDHPAFRTDPSTDGMAAFPGVTHARARAIAWREAIERFSLVTWWNGHLAGELRALSDDFWQCELASIDDRTLVTVLCRKNSFLPTYYAYGFGAGASRQTSRWNAEKELTRNEFVLQQYYLQRSSLEMNEIIHPDEKRLLYFSTPEGHERWKETALKSARVQIVPPSFKPIFDGKVLGPWTKYAKVWRVAPPPYDPTESNNSVFVF
jgi:hypothetical protein